VDTMKRRRRAGARREQRLRLTILFAADNKGSKWAIAEHGFMARRAGYGRRCHSKAGKLALC